MVKTNCELEIALAQAVREIECKDKEIAELRADLESARNEADALCVMVRRRNAEIAELTEQIAMALDW